MNWKKYFILFKKIANAEFFNQFLFNFKSIGSNEFENSFYFGEIA